MRMRNDVVRRRDDSVLATITATPRVRSSVGGEFGDEKIEAVGISLGT
jgi:hypothetical protein